MVKRCVIVGLIVALCIMATPVLAAYSCDPICEPDPNGSDKCCFGEGTPTSNNGVIPDAWNDNPTCEDLGFDNGIKFDPPTPSTSGDFLWNFDPADPFVTWSSSVAVNAVIMKGGEVGANVYHYSQPSLGDSGLATPVNPSGKPAGLSHIDFCYNNEGCNCPVNDCSTGTCDQAGACIYEAPGTTCDGGVGVCDGNGNCEGVPVPEFPSLALPAALIIGLVGLVFAVKTLK